MLINKRVIKLERMAQNHRGDSDDMLIMKQISENEHLMDRDRNPRKSLHLDTTKLSLHRDRVEALARGERIAPITIDMALTQKCSASCTFCVEENQPITMADGTSKAIKDVRIGDSVRSVDAAGRLVASEVKAAWQSNPNAPTLQLYLHSYKLVCTGNHPILTKRGWVRADEIKTGEEVAVANVEQRQSYEEPRNQGQGYRSQQGQRGLQEIWGTIQGASRGGEDAAPKVFLQRGARSHLASHETEQSYEAARSRSQGALALHARASQGNVGDYEEVLARGENYSPPAWYGKEQVGGNAFPRSRNYWVSLHRGRNSLDRGNEKRHPQKPGLRLEVSNTQDSLSPERCVLPSGQGTAGSGTGGLPFGRLEGVDFLGDESRCKMASSDSLSSGDEFCNWQRIISIEAGPDSAVYDLECYPHHNFVASGVVVHNCYAGLQQLEAEPVKWEVYERFLDDCAEVGVKAISLVSDGESTENPHYVDFIVKARSLGLDIAIGTNGFKLRAIETLVKNLTYLRINFNAADPERNASIMGVSTGFHHKVVENIKEAVRLKRLTGAKCTIGLQQVLLPSYADQVIPLALLGRELGVDYFVIKHCSDDEEGRLGVNYQWYRTNIAEQLFKAAEALSTDTYSVQAKWTKFRTGKDRNYSKCFGTALHLQMSGTGIVAPCGSFFNAKYADKHIADIKHTRFRDIVKSDRYWEVINYLKGDYFNPKTDCAQLCLQDKSNEALFNMFERGVPIPSAADNSHRNFL